MPKVALEIQISQLTIDKKLDVPLYQQLYQKLRLAILQGVLRPNERLPATRRLGEELGISRNIISKAFEQLTIEGYLKATVGSGTYVNDSIPDNFIQPSPAKEKKRSSSPASVSQFSDDNPFLLARNIQREPVVPFQNAIPAIDSFPFKIWSSIAAKQYQNMQALHLGYEDAAGYLPLREAIASYLRVYRGVRCESDQVLIVNGTQQGITLLSSCLIKPNDQVIVEDPGYAGVRIAFAHAKAKICPVPVERDGVNVKFAIDKYKHARCIYLTPAHQYPLGGTLSLQKRLQLLDWAQQVGAWILEDDYDSELRYAGKPLSALQGIDNYGRVIYIGSFSKVVFPGLRIAYMVFPDKQMTDHFAKIKAIFDRQSPIMEQAILTSFLSEGHFFRHLRKMRVLYAERQQQLLTAIAKEAAQWFNVGPEEAGMHLVAWLTKNIDDKTVSRLLREEGIVANALSEYVMKYKQPPALILGYSAFNKFKLRHHMMKVGIVMEKTFGKV